jgi:thioredoxin 1
MKLLWFTAPWCRPCKNMAPVIDELQDDLPDLKVEKLDVEQFPDVTELMGVKGLPTFIRVDDNERPGERITGSTTKAKLLELLKK